MHPCNCPHHGRSPRADLFELPGDLFWQTILFSHFWCSRPALWFVLLYGGNIPFVESLCFASQRIPTVCPNCAGSISTIGLAPFCLKSAGLALIWASAVLLWFLALLYTRGRGLSIRRMHNELDIFFQEMTKKLYCSYKRTIETASLRSLDGPQCLLWKTSAQELPDFFRAIFRRGEQNAQWAYIIKQVILLNKNKPPIKKISWIAHLTAIWILYTRYTWSV